MKKSGGVFLIVMICLLTLLSTALFCKTLISKPQDINNKSAGSQVEKTTLLTQDFMAQINQPKENENTLTKSSDKEAAGKANALGSIKEQFFSPYAANLVYNNICVKNKTSFNINLKDELKGDFGLKINNKSEPLVLIVHTHTTESYLKEDKNYYTDSDYSRTTDEKGNMVAIGEEFAKKLTAAGIGVIHDKTVHDYPSYSGSYSRSEKTVTDNLKKYPTVKIVLDIHRDSISAGNNDKIKPTATINGKKAAQIMLVMGSQDGKVTNFPNWRQNFRLAIRFQQILEAKYSGLARAMLLNPKKYNEHLSTGSMLIEVGSDANTLEEAKYSAGMAGDALACLINTLCTDNE